MESFKLTFETDRSQIVYLGNLIESYDGMAVASTVEPHRAIMELKIAPGCEGLISELLNYLKKEEKIKINPLSL